MSTRPTRRRRASFGRRCQRLWFRNNGRVVRVLWFDDFSQCESGGEPVSYIKVLTHKRYARGIYDQSLQFLEDQIVNQVTPGVWTQIVFSYPEVLP